MPDNLKAGVTQPHRYEPLVNRTYEELADHYGAVVIPARSRKPRDKAKVEASVGLASRWVPRTRTSSSPASAKAISRARSRRRPAATATAPSTAALRASSTS